MLTKASFVPLLDDSFSVVVYFSEDYVVIQIGSSYYLSSISILSNMKKMEESTCRVILMVGNNLENWGLKPFEAILRHKMDCFGVKNFLDLARIP
jgi:hypothetical protein